MRIKILYVEDELFLGKIVKESLESRGYDVEMVSDGNNVIATFNKYVPDICILDVMLPNKSGFELAKQIRNINVDIPILFLTAKTQTDDVVQGFKLGGNDYVRKPFSLEELIVRIENLLNIYKHDIHVDGIVSIGQYTFDSGKQILLLHQEERKLSYRETQLLQFLFTHRNAIVERKDLMNHIWGNDSFFNSRNLDVYITKIRSYLKEDPFVEILTIKGVGYRFIC